ncbi:FAD-dependent oxidoreductase [Cystobacter ferrugineus]|uniref:2,4-dichlorophenol 6-monooxygenase n=1 Tax=Cystobacter ferrugineus TaxID=83449 RepID=A0A1L9B7D4_9BACT|nr:FAD-dependent oxidoreductase [Cystobacter ferrugineus]OJH38167.1 2,4-dichlorophenol 6-monooxygenase [Cystobacter ferrugineus]
METNSTSVLVVGGGLVGLSAALFLSWRGVPTVLVERHAGSSAHPRAIGYTPRTLELLRAVGLGARVPQAPPDFRLQRARVESLAGEWFEESSWTQEEHKGPKREYSPCSGAAIAQDRLEPILRDKAVELGADLRFQTELVRFEQDADGVTALLRERNGREYTMRASYLVAADGHRSPIRAALGIGRDGRGHMRTLRSVLFRAPLEEYLRKGITQFEIDQADLKAFLTTYGDGRWVLMFSDDKERDEETLRAMVHKAIGRSDLEIELITTGRWELSALIADRFASNRVFLAGDAAHTLPPSRGGFGANTGIEDAHNLAWKLAAVLSGTSAPRLLETYDAERRPIAWLRHQQIFVRNDYKADANGTAADAPIIDDDAMEFGQLYRSTAVLGAGDDLPPASRPDTWAGQPGTRAPHLWVTQGGERKSTLDLFQRSWVLLTEDERWLPAAAKASERLAIELECPRIGLDVKPSDPDAFRMAFGLKPGGASLIRPDGYVAWRSLDLPADPLSALTDALGQVSAAAALPHVKG